MLTEKLGEKVQAVFGSPDEENAGQTSDLKTIQEKIRKIMENRFYVSLSRRLLLLDFAV